MAQNIRQSGSGGTTQPPVQPPNNPDLPNTTNDGDPQGPNEPIENLIGPNTCPPGYSLGRDTKNGQLMCYKNDLFKGLPHVVKLKIGKKS